MPAAPLVDVDGRRLRLTNLDKVLYPETGTTKGDVIHYYATIAPALLPHLAERPVTRKRWPDGVGSAAAPIEAFFEKDLGMGVPDWVLRQTINEQRSLSACGHSLAFNVNVSAYLLADRDFAQWVLETIRSASAPIGIEITETAMIADPAGALRNLHLFADAGIRIAIDDYGAGLSSLAYLKQLPAHELKIDRMFISGLSTSHRDPLLVRSTIDLAHALEMEVTAEGVDSAATMALLRVMGCDLMQGYLIAKPMPLGELRAFLDTRDAAGEPAIPVAFPWAKPVATAAGQETMAGEGTAKKQA